MVSVTFFLAPTPLFTDNFDRNGFAMRSQHCPGIVRIMKRSFWGVVAAEYINSNGSPQDNGHQSVSALMRIVVSLEFHTFEKYEPVYYCVNVWPHRCGLHICAKRLCHAKRCRPFSNASDLAHTKAMMRRCCRRCRPLLNK